MDGAKASTAGIDLPTGVLVGDQVVRAIRFRELAGPEEDVLASNIPASLKMTEIMSNCTLEFGGVTNRAEIRKMVEKLLITDRWFYLVQLRVLSLGSSYVTEVKCPSCGAEGKETFDLRTIAVKDAPDAKECFFEIELPKSKRKIRWKLADGETDLRIEKMANQERAASVALFARVTEVDGRPASIADIIDLPMSDRAVLRKAQEEKEGQFDDLFETICKKCGEKHSAQLQLDGRSFFSL